MDVARLHQMATPAATAATDAAAMATTIIADVPAATTYYTQVIQLLSSTGIQQSKAQTIALFVGLLAALWCIGSKFVSMPTQSSACVGTCISCFTA